MELVNRLLQRGLRLLSTFVQLVREHCLILCDLSTMLAQSALLVVRRMPLCKLVDIFDVWAHVLTAVMHSARNFLLRLFFAIRLTVEFTAHC